MREKQEQEAKAYLDDIAMQNRLFDAWKHSLQEPPQEIHFRAPAGIWIFDVRGTIGDHAGDRKPVQCDGDRAFSPHDSCTRRQTGCVWRDTQPRTFREGTAQEEQGLPERATEAKKRREKRRQR